MKEELHMSDQFNQNQNREDVIDVNFNKFKKGAKGLVTTVIIVLLAAFLGLNSFYMLDDREQGVILRFGQFYRVEENAGPHFKMPIVETVRKVPTEKVFEMEYGYRTTIAGTKTSNPEYADASDEAQVIVDGANNNASIALLNLTILYKINNPVNYLFKVDDVEGTLRLALEDVVRNTYQAYTLEDARTDKKKIDDDIKPALQKKLDTYGAGLEIQSVQTQNVELLPAVDEAYKQKENAKQYKNGKLEEAEKYYNTIIPQAEAEAQRLREEASGYKAEVIANARASVAQYEALYKEYLNNPDIVKEKYYIESMSHFIKNNNIVLDGTNGSSIHKFFNLDNENIIKEQVSSSN